MELIRPNNYCHLCRIPHLHFATYHELADLSYKTQNDPDISSQESESAEEFVAPSSRQSH